MRIRRGMKRATVVLTACLVAVTLSSCGKKHPQAVCVDRFNQIVDPVACQALQAEASSHRNDQSWIEQYLLYQWAYGGRQNGMTYVTTQYVPVYEPLPSRYRPMSQATYVKSYRSVTHRTPSTLPRPVTTTTRASTTSASSAVPKPTTTAPKTRTTKASSPRTTTRPRPTTTRTRSKA